MSRSALIAALRGGAAPGLAHLDSETLARLWTITTDLVASSPEAAASAENFERQRERGLDLDRCLLRSGVENMVVLVTGGTGCIGTALLRELRQFAPKHLVSLTRGLTPRAADLGSVTYLDCDIRENHAVRSAFERVRPDIVFHLAAQRDPGLAERTERASLETNIFGTRNVFAASIAAGVRSVVYASTGKALRPFTPHIYAASKKIGELLAHASAQESRSRFAVVRFTHVVDNSLVLHRFRAIGADQPLRVHDPAIQFYMQSAREAAQLLMWAHVAESADGVVDVMAIRDLGMPADLLDIALAVVGESPHRRPIYIAGYEPGYEDSVYPGMYDPETAAEISPLLNSFEAVHARDVGDVGIDASAIRIPRYGHVVDMLPDLDPALHPAATADSLRDTLNSVSMTLLEAILDAVDPSSLKRILRLTAPWRSVMSTTNLAIDDCLRERAAELVF